MPSPRRRRSRPRKTSGRAVRRAKWRARPPPRISTTRQSCSPPRRRGPGECRTTPSRTPRGTLRAGRLGEPWAARPPSRLGRRPVARQRLAGEVVDPERPERTAHDERQPTGTDGVDDPVRRGIDERDGAVLVWDPFEPVGTADTVSGSPAGLDGRDDLVRRGVDLADASVHLVGHPDAVVVRVDADGASLADRARPDGARRRVDAVDLIGPL